MKSQKFVINVDETSPEFLEHIKERLKRSKDRKNLIPLKDFRKALTLHQKELTDAKI